MWVRATTTEEKKTQNIIIEVHVEHMQRLFSYNFQNNFFSSFSAFNREYNGIFFFFEYIEWHVQTFICGLHSRNEYDDCPIILFYVGNSESIHVKLNQLRTYRHCNVSKGYTVCRCCLQFMYIFENSKYNVMTIILTSSQLKSCTWIMVVFWKSLIMNMSWEDVQMKQKFEYKCVSFQRENYAS